MSTDKFVKLGFLLTATDGMSKVLEKAGSNATGTMSKLAKFGAGTMQVGGQIAAVGKVFTDQLIDLGKGAMEYGDRIAKVSRKLGVDAGQYAGLEFAAGFAGVSEEKLQTGILGLTKSMGAAVSSSKDKMAAFADLGIKITNDDGSMRDSVAVLKDMATLYASSGDNATKTLHALETMGKSGADMINLLNEGGEGLTEWLKKADAMGFVWDGSSFKNAEVASDSITMLQKSFEGLKLTVGKSLFEPVIQLCNALIPLANRFSKWAAENPKLVSTLVKVAGGIGAAITAAGGLAIAIGGMSYTALQFGKVASGIGRAGRGIGMTFKVLSSIGKGTALAQVVLPKPLYSMLSGMHGLVTKLAPAFGRFFGVMGKGVVRMALAFVKCIPSIIAFNVALWTNPITWIIIGIVALIAAVVLLIRNWSKVKTFFVNLWTSIKAVFGNAWSAIVGSISAIWNNIAAWFNELKDRFFEWGGNLIDGLIEGIVAFASKIWGKIKEIGKGIKDAFCNILGINSPSKVFMEYGMNITRGLTLGIDTGSGDAAASMGAMGGGMLPAFAAPANMRTVGSLGGGASFVYSPTIQVNGGGTASGMREVLNGSYADFVAMLRKYEHERARKYY